MPNTILYDAPLSSLITLKVLSFLFLSVVLLWLPRLLSKNSDFRWRM
jgi:hypothetical protein